MWALGDEPGSPRLGGRGGGEHSLHDADSVLVFGCWGELISGLSRGRLGGNGGGGGGGVSGRRGLLGS
jgi:hypothetical protein